MTVQGWPGASQQVARARMQFAWAWGLVTAIKLGIAWRLPLFVDEAFYWQEGRHLAAAYSDLPGLTAWLIRLGTAIGGEQVLAVRAPFLLMAALMPWLVGRIARRWHGELAGWRAALLMVLMPLSGSLGLLALPDVPMLLATILCMDAGARLLREVDAANAAELALGLAIGALCHYRFIGVIGVGFVALLLLAEGRRALRDPRVWVALAVGIAAWAPLIAWNVNNADAGLRFQLVDRHPWSLHIEGLWFLLVQALLVTPLLFVALLQLAWRARSDAPGTPQWRYFGLLGGLTVLGYFVLGFFADVERVSFHWPLPGYVALLVGVPALLQAWRPAWRRLLWGLAGAGLLLMLGYYAALAVPALRAQSAGQKYYPRNFAGWDALAEAVREEQGRPAPGARLLADNFKVGAELGFQLSDADIAVLDHPLNHKHGRAPQLRLWGLQQDAAPRPALLVVSANDVSYKDLLQRYHDLCRMLGPLPAPARVVNVDHGAVRFLLFRLPAGRAEGPCTTPAMAWIDAPQASASVAGKVRVHGWAFKDGVGLGRVELLLDGRPVAEARYGLPAPGVAAYWRISSDPGHPDVGFEAELDLSNVAPGRHWLGLRLHGKDGSVEDWAEQPVRVR